MTNKTELINHDYLCQQTHSNCCEQKNYYDGMFTFTTINFLSTTVELLQHKTIKGFYDSIAQKQTKIPPNESTSSIIVML